MEKFQRQKSFQSFDVSKSDESFIESQLHISQPPCQLGGIVAKKWDPGILDPSRFSAQIRKVEARLGKLAKIRNVETN